MGMYKGNGLQSHNISIILILCGGYAQLETVDGFLLAFFPTLVRSGIQVKPDELWGSVAECLDNNSRIFDALREPAA
jgi:hypothetical protein